MTTLYAWVNPVSWDPLVDHTWVTDYPTPTPPYPDIQAVKAAGGTYWYCWGIYHPAGHSKTYPGGAIGNQAGDLAVSTCICTPMIPSKGNPSAQGSIYQYGFDGVCHQLANQVLISTGLGGAAPLTVSKARGYPTSCWLYGPYGLNVSGWKALLAKCLPPILPDTGQQGGLAVASDDDGDHDAMDEFQIHISEDLDDAKQGFLMELRSSFQQEVVGLRAMAGQQGAIEINKLIGVYLARAAEALTPDEYERVFGHPADGPTPNLVDPDMM